MPGKQALRVEQEAAGTETLTQQRSVESKQSAVLATLARYGMMQLHCLRA